MATTIAQVGLTPQPTPASTTGAVIKIRARKANLNDNGVVRVWLYEGSTLRAGPFDSPLTDVFQTISVNLPSANVATIQNWENLSLAIQGVQNVGSTLTVQVSSLSLDSAQPQLTPVAQFSLSPAPKPVTVNPSGSSYGVGTYGTATYVTPANIFLNVRARFLNVGDVGYLRVWLYEGTTLREGPYDIPLTSSFTTNIHQLANSWQIGDWTNLNVEVQGLANGASTLTAQVSGVNLQSPVPSTISVTKTGGAISTLIAGGSRFHQKFGGGISNAQSGAVKTYRFVKKAGGISLVVAGGVEAIGSPTARVTNVVEFRLNSPSTLPLLPASFGSGGLNLANGISLLGGQPVTLSIRARAVNSTDAGVLRGWITDNGQAVEGPFDLPLTTSFQTFAHVVANVTSITNWATIDVQLQGISNPGSQLTVQVSWIDLSSTPSTVFVNYQKIGGGLSSVVSGGTRFKVVYAKTGGGLSSVKTGGTKRNIDTKTGGGISLVRAGGIENVQSTKTGGSIGLLIGGVAKFVTITKTSGAISQVYGGSGRNTYSARRGGGISTLISGSPYRKVSAETGGGISVVIAGAPHGQGALSHKGGGISTALGSASKTFSVRKQSGVIGAILAGGSKVVVIQNFTFVSKSGGSISLATSGTTKHITYSKVNGAISSTFAGGVKGETITRRGGGASKALSGGLRFTTTIKFGGGISLDIGGGVRLTTVYKTSGIIGELITGANKVVSFDKTSGGTALVLAGSVFGQTTIKIGGVTATINAGVDPFFAYVLVQSIGGANSIAISGGMHISSSGSLSGGAIGETVAGATKEVSYIYNVLGRKPTPILSTQVR